VNRNRYVDDEPSTPLLHYGLYVLLLALAVLACFPTLAAGLSNVARSVALSLIGGTAH